MRTSQGKGHSPGHTRICNCGDCVSVHVNFHVESMVKKLMPGETILHHLGLMIVNRIWYKNIPQFHPRILQHCYNCWIKKTKQKQKIKLHYFPVDKH